MPSSRNVTDEPVGPDERFALYRLCECIACDGSGKGFRYENGSWHRSNAAGANVKCPQCRGEGRTRDLVATCATPEAIGTALYTLALEGEWDECPIGILDRLPEPGSNQKWLVRPWLPSARNVSDAGRTLAKHGRSKT